MRTSTPSIGVPTDPLLVLNGWFSVTIGAVSVSPYPWMTANPIRRQNSSRSGGSGAAPTTNAQNFKPNAECARR